MRGFAVAVNRDLNSPLTKSADSDSGLIRDLGGARMALGRQGDRQGDLVVTWKEMPRSPGHVFYDRLQGVLIAAGFDAFAETTCKPYYAAKMGGRAIDSTWPVLPDAHGRLLRGDQLRAGDRVALRRLAVAQGVSASADDRVGSGGSVALTGLGG